MSLKQNEYFLQLSNVAIDLIEACSSDAPNEKALPVVLCLHGFPDNKHSFDKLLEPLTNAGYRVIVPGLPGYCPESSITPLPSKWQLGMVLAELIEKLDLNDIHLVAHDWGGYMGAQLMYHMPERFRSFSIFAIYLYDSLLCQYTEEEHQQRMMRSWYNVMLRIEGFSDRVLEMNDFELIELLWRNWSPNWKFTSEELNLVKDTFRKPNVVTQATNYYKELSRPQKNGEPSMLDVLKKTVEVPVLYCVGAEDGCMNVEVFKNHTKSENYPNGLTLQVVQTGHFPHREAPDEVGNILLRFFKGVQ